MPTNRFTALKDFKYGTRMMRAGDEVEMTGPHARLYTALGAIGPLKARREPAATVKAPKPAAKRAPRKRKAAAKKK